MITDMANINIRVDEKLKKDSDGIFEELGMSMTTAITIFLKAVVRNNSIPFPLEIPNEETLSAINEVKQIDSGEVEAKRYHSVAELRKDLKV